MLPPAWRNKSASPGRMGLAGGCQALDLVACLEPHLHPPPATCPCWCILAQRDDALPAKAAPSAPTVRFQSEHTAEGTEQPAPSSVVSLRQQPARTGSLAQGCQILTGEAHRAGKGPSLPPQPGAPTPPPSSALPWPCLSLGGHVPTRHVCRLPSGNRPLVLDISISRAGSALFCPFQ